ncbi:MAG: hypothetical protein AO394_03610 [Candidatus Fermentibacter daniensis]|jgi:hypothetical protein|nr:MAG: hypothetical protein AO394_03610 [Candidatus Fermentibacter daniensis]
MPVHSVNHPAFGGGEEGPGAGQRTRDLVLGKNIGAVEPAAEYEAGERDPEGQCPAQTFPPGRAGGCGDGLAQIDDLSVIRRSFP